jgi:uncharacterized protein YbdZ (MbtH family)
MTTTNDDPSEERYVVVFNHEEQYSIWPAERDLPPGWSADGFGGSKDECLAHVEEVWTDMRPLSLRRFMEQAGEQTDAETDAPEDAEEPLVTRLSRGDHPVEVSLRPERTGAALRDAIDSGYVYLKFTATRGGTELGVRVDPQACDLGDADFDAPRGRVRIVGDLTLDFDPVRCTAEIDLATMAGQGRLSLREAAP